MLKVPILHFPGGRDDESNVATAHGAAVEGAQEYELDNEEGLQGGSVVSETGPFTIIKFIQNGHFVECASGSNITVASDGGEDGSGEEGDARAHRQENGAHEKLGRDAWDKDANKHANGQDKHGQVHVGVKGEDSAPAGAFVRHIKLTSDKGGS